MKKYYLYIFVVVIALLSCNDDEEYNSYLYGGNAFNVLDEQGNDLLDPQSENSIDTTKIKIYYLHEGKKVSFANYHAQQGYVLDDQKGFVISTPQQQIYGNDNYILGISFSMGPYDKDGVCWTLVEWNEFDTDTIKSKVEKKGNSMFFYMISYNDISWTKEQTLASEVFKITK